MLLLAAAAGAVWSVIDPSRAVWVVVSVLIVTCPCALSLAAPSALLAAAGALGRRGVLLRRLDAIDELARMTIAVRRQDRHADAAAARLRGRRAAGAGLDADDRGAAAQRPRRWRRGRTHPLALAIVRRCAAAGAAPRWPGSACAKSRATGLEAIDAQGRSWRLGAPRWVGASPRRLPRRRRRCWLGCDAPAAAALSSSTRRCAPSAAAAVRALRADGVQVHLLSGDARSKRAQRSAARLELDSAGGGLTPEHKLAAVQAAQARGAVVAMVGDGINDAPVLARADVSFAMGEGAAVARAQADGVLVSNRLADLRAARALAKRALRIVRQNLAWAAPTTCRACRSRWPGCCRRGLAGLGMAAQLAARGAQLAAPGALS